MLEPAHAELPAPPRGVRVRSADVEDLPALVEASRASLLEEDRPDPTETDPVGFRRWVAGRTKQAVVAEERGRVGFVGYADVRSPRGWLLQGVYTWPSFRRRGLARAGVAELCRRAFAESAEHVQLAVVEGNAPAVALYEQRGLVRFARLRTVLSHVVGGGARRRPARGLGAGEAAAGQRPRGMARFGPLEGIAPETTAGVA